MPQIRPRDARAHRISISLYFTGQVIAAATVSFRFVAVWLLADSESGIDILAA